MPQGKKMLSIQNSKLCSAVCCVNSASRLARGSAVLLYLWISLLSYRLWGQSQREFIYMDGRLIAVESQQNCTYSISPTTSSAAAAGANGNVSVTSGSGCAWSAASNSAWITITGGGSGTGNGTVGYSVAANTGSARSGTMTIAGKTFTVNQVSASCTYSINPTGASIASGGGIGSFSITSGSGCTWTTASNDTWIAITSGGSGNGNGTVSYSVTANTGLARSGTISAAGKIFTVSQANGCSYSINPASNNIGSAGGNGSVSVSGGSGCAWSASSNSAWITITGRANGSGNGTVNYSVTANTGPARNGTLTIAGQTFTVNQGNGCSYSINPNTGSIAAGGGSGSFTVTSGSGCAWSATSNSGWIAITGGSSGSGNGTVSYSVAANTGPPRNGTISIPGQTFTISQADGCSHSINPAGNSIAAGGGTGSVSVTGGSGCSWSAASNDWWITIIGGGSGSGNGTVSYSVAANSGPDRSGTLIIAGQAFTISQANGCTYSISPTQQDFTYQYGEGTVAVTAGSGCSWTATTQYSWIHITSGSSGTGNGTVSYYVSPNTGASRLGSISIAGRRFEVWQETRPGGN